MRRFGLLSLAMFAAVPWTGAGAREHPFLFVTSEDVERARRSMQEDAEIASLARGLVERARNVDPGSLPSLDPAWWEPLRDRPWQETYPEIYEGTLRIPIRWAAAARDCARASLLDDDPDLARKGRDLLLALSGYTFEFDHYDVGMNYTVWGFQALDAYDILYDGFSGSERKRLDAFFDRMLQAVVRSDEFWIENEPGGPMNNHYAWHKLCRCMIGLFYGRNELVEEALHGPKGLDVMFRHGFRDDGLWLEGSIPYQFAATGPFLLMAEMLENSGYPASLWIDDVADGRNLRQAYDALFGLLFPDGTLPSIGDCYAVRTRPGTKPAYRILYRRFGDPRYAWLIRRASEDAPADLFGGALDIPDADPLGQISRLWPEQGYAALRSVEGPEYWTGRGYTVFATYSNALVHSNADKLSMMLFADGRLWLPDCEAKTSAGHAFSAAIQRELNRETVCHNTLLVDRRGQRHPDRRLDLVEFHALSGEKVLTIGDLDGRLYPGVRQLRTLIVRDDYVLDLFQAESAESRRWEWMTHVDGDPVASSLDGDWIPHRFPDGGPWKYLGSAEECAAPARSWEVFGAEDRRFRCDLLVSAEPRVVRCGFPRDDGAEPERIPMRFYGVEGSSAWFLALYRSGAGPEDEAVLEVAPDVLGSWAVTVSFGDRRVRHRMPMLSATR